MSNLELVSYLGAAQCLMFAVALWLGRAGQNYANRFLAALIAIIGYYLLTQALAATINNPSWVILPTTGALVIFATGPLLWFYVRSLCEPDFSFWPEHRIHLLPAIVVPLLISIYAVLWITPNISSGWPVVQPQIQASRILRAIITLLLSVSLIGYAIAAKRSVNQHKRRIRLVASTLDSVNLPWANFFIYAVILFPVGGFVLSLIKLVSDVDLVPYSTLLIILTLLISQSIVFAGLRQSSIHYSPEEWRLVRGSSAVAKKSIGSPTETNPDVVQDDDSNEKYAHSSLDEAGAQDIWNRLGDYMEQQKPHLEPELKISDLATALALSVDHISQTLNRHGGENFHEFINRHRIEYAKSLLHSNEHRQRKMLDIAMESGFNSQSTFYSHFKKYQQQTPAAFRSEQLK